MEAAVTPSLFPQGCVTDAVRPFVTVSLWAHGGDRQVHSKAPTNCVPLSAKSSRYLVGLRSQGRKTTAL